MLTRINARLRTKPQFPGPLELVGFTRIAESHGLRRVEDGRERYHFLNPVPIHEIQERWISGFEQPRLHAIGAIKQRAEEYAMTNAPTPLPTFVYVTYIRATAEQVWQALTDADLTARYWGHANVSDWQPGSPWDC